MISSMTGYGTGEVSIRGVRHFVEIKTLNSKFCEVKTRLPLDIMGLDLMVQVWLKEQFSRGRIEFYLTREIESLSASEVKVNWDLADKYYRAYQDLRKRFGINQDVTLSMMVQSKEVVCVSHEPLDMEALWKELLPAVEQAVAGVRDMRAVEGRALAMDLAARINRIREWSGEIEALGGEVLEHYRERLEKRIQAITGQELEQDRLAQEVALLADRSDITEETVRIRSHLQQFLNYLEDGQALGRTLDFLSQELNREINTLAAKSSSARISHIAVNIKAELEKIREQAQNVE